MGPADFPASLLLLIRSSVPTFAAAELLLFLRRHPTRCWPRDEIGTEIRPTIIAPSAIQEYLVLFKANGLVQGSDERGFEYSPSTPALEAAIAELARAYDERPVTLIRTIYSIADLRIQSFADSFRLKSKDREE